MQSPDNIAALTQAVEGGQVTATTSSVHSASGLFTASLASVSAYYEQVGYMPQIRAQLSQETVAEGGTITITGSGFGSTPGSARILASTSAIALPVALWTPTRITVTVPAHTAGGLVSVTTSTADTAMAGLIGVTTEGRNRVAHLTYVRSPRAFDGEPQIIEIGARDTGGHPVRAAAVQVIGAGEAFHTVTAGTASGRCGYPDGAANRS